MAAWESQSGTKDVKGSTNYQTSIKKLVRCFEPAVEKKPQFEIDLQVERVSQDAILKDEEKMDEINEKLEKLKMGSCAEFICRFVERSYDLHGRIKSCYLRDGQHGDDRLETNLGDHSVSFLPETCVNVAYGYDPIKERWTESEKHLQR